MPDFQKLTDEANKAANRLENVEQNIQETTGARNVSVMVSDDSIEVHLIFDK